MLKKWAIIAHGGAKDINDNAMTPNREGMKQAIEKGIRILSGGGSALDAIEETVKSLEDNPAFNAGFYGSVKNEEGKIELTASIMDGNTLDIGAVAGIKEVKNPVSAARALLGEKTIFLIGEGARKFASEKSLLTDLKPIPCADDNPDCDTVGCVALDSHGNLAAATSTGGLKGVRVGRVGDVPLPGCGFYADNLRGAASASGEGETIARVMLVSEFIHFLKDMSPNEAVAKALQQLQRVNGEAGLIAIAPDGTIGWGHNSPYFAVAMASSNSSMPRVFLNKAEEK